MTTSAFLGKGDEAPRRPVRVCHLAYTFYETDNRVVRYARALVDRGDEVDVIALRRTDQSYSSVDAGVRVCRLQHRTKNETRAWMYLPKLLSFMVLSFFVLSARHLRRRYDVIHVHNVPDFLVFSALLPKLTGARILLDIHDVLPELFADKFRASHSSSVFRSLLALERWSCAFADTVIVANHIWHQRLVERATPAHKCVALLNYPDLRVFTPRDTPAAGDASFLVLYPGSLSHHQGLDVAIRAFALVKHRLDNAEFHIYGEGPAKPQLMSLAATLSVSTMVQFHEPVAVGQIAQIMRLAAVGVEPKLAGGFSTEALSTKILELMACGVPVIASRTRAHEHYFTDRVITFFPSGDVEALGAALVDHFERRRTARQLRDAASFAREYDWRAHVGMYYQLVEPDVAGTSLSRVLG